MIGLVIVAHGGLAREFLAATEHVVGPQMNARAIATHPDDDLAEKQAEIDEAVADVDCGDGVALITDMFGGTPCNLALGAMTPGAVEIICGANLPMLVKLAKMRDRPLMEATRCAKDAGIKYISCPSSVLHADAG